MLGDLCHLDLTLSFLRFLFIKDLQRERFSQIIFADDGEVFAAQNCSEPDVTIKGICFAPRKALSLLSLSDHDLSGCEAINLMSTSSGS